MTVTVTTDRTGPLIADSADPLPFTFQAISAAEIEVYLDDVLVDPNGYTVVLNGDGTGSVVPLDPWDGEVYILSAPSFQQPFTFNRFVPLYPDQIVPPLDRLAKTIVALRNRLSRGLPQIGDIITGAAGGAAAIVARLVGGQTYWDITLPTGEQGPAGDVAKESSRVNLGNVIAPLQGMARYLNENGREGLFDFSEDDLSAAVADDPLQGVYVAPASDASGASGAWVRKHPGEINVRWFGATGDGVTDDTAAIQAALDYANSIGGAKVLFPAVVPQVTTSYKVTSYLSIYPKTRIKGMGRSATKIVSAAAGGGGANASENVRNGSIFYSGQAINGSTRVDIYIEDIGLANTNGANVGAGYYDRGGTFWSMRRVRIDGFQYGVVMEQSELCDIYEGDFENQLSAGVWIVDGADLTPGAAGDWANRIGIYNSQFNQPAGAYCIRDGGGANHAFVDNNYNGGLNSILIEGTTPVIVRGGQFESAAGSNIKLTGANYLAIEGGTYTQTAGNAAIDFTGGGGTLSLSGVPVFSGGAGENPIVGAANLFRLWLGPVANNTAVALYDATPTHLHDTTDDSVPPLEVAWGSQLVFKDVVDDSYASYEEHVSEAGVRWHQVVAKGGGGGWAGGYRIKLNHNAGALFEAFNMSSNGDGVTASANHVGTFNVSNPTPANAAYKINGTKVIGAQGAAVADAAALTSVNATNAAAAPTQAEFNAFVAEFNKLRTDLGNTRTQLNAALARLRAATGHGLIA